MEMTAGYKCIMNLTKQIYLKKLMKVNLNQ